ncbi:MAG: L-2-hydroxyglutarate oxidase [Anaerolineales bacterium]|nr:L-2-hydroxyglutarate oxidase [Anaerolineales bacterium]
MYDFAVIGGGIVGLSTAMHLSESFPDRSILVIEKEDHLAEHQTGRNSGVIHSGVYYKPGSLKAQLAVRGNQAMVAFCKENGIAHDMCGKVIVATQEWERPLLENIFQRGQANGVKARKIGSGELKDIEPHVRGLEAIRVLDAGIVDYTAVVRKFAEILVFRGGSLQLGARLKAISTRPEGLLLHTSQGEFLARYLINCAGLHSDRVTRMSKLKPQVRIVPFRGEYYSLVPERRNLVRGLVYPVPNPAFPFLGVHFTRMIDGGIHAGPNAVLALKREGYRKTDFSLGDSLEVISFPGFWRLVLSNLGEGLKEIYRSLNKAAFVRSLQTLVPEVRTEDLIPSPAGVRAQALYRDGQMADDFVIIRDQRCLHVCNAPSPAATASIEIGRYISEQVSEMVVSVSHTFVKS